jgi:hypothetical protein
MTLNVTSKAVRIFAGVGSLSLTALLIMSTQAPDTVNGNMRWLQTNGRWIVNSLGETMLLHGVNFYGNEFGALGIHTEEDYRRIKSYGFNVVRLPISWALVEPCEGFYDESYLLYVDKDIAWAKKYGLYVILDMHQWQWSPYFTYSEECGSGVPSWTVGKYPDTEDGKNRAVADFWLGKGPNGSIASQTNASLKDRYIAAWRYVVSRYSKEETIMAYDLFNEPPDSSNVKLESEDIKSELFDFYKELFKAIRELDSNHILIYEGLNGSAWWSELIDEPNVAFSTHYYDLNSTYDGNKTKLEEDFLTRRWNSPKQNPIKNWNIPVLIGEFGYDEDWQNCNLWTRDILHVFERYPISGWFWWTYGKSDMYGKALLMTNGSERSQLEYLDGPFPRKTTFAPHNWAFEYESKEFSLDAPQGRNTVEIYLPARYYPDFHVAIDATEWKTDWDLINRTLTILYVSEKTINILVTPRS